jgi:DNA processing protein
MNHEYAVWLAERPGFSSELKIELLEHFGSAEAVWRAEEQDYLPLSGLKKQQREALMQKGMEHAQIILRDCAKYNIRVISMEEPDYPNPLRDLPDAPTVLYVRGTLPDWDTTIAIGIVGTRHATPYGLGAARWLSSNLAHAGCVIVSGMALGVDGEANRGALNAAGTTVAVLGCGADVCYPSSHKKLMDDIVKRGAVITEYPPGTEPRGYHFPLRNRIISGLSRGVVVIEAPERSGALITADRALEQGRDVFAVPGNINSPQSAGSNQLLREGAELVTCAADVLAHYPEESRLLVPTRLPSEKAPLPKETVPNTNEKVPSTEETVSGGREKPAAKQPKKTKSSIRLSPEEQTVLDAIRNGADSRDAIIDATGQKASRVLACLTMLEINGMIHQDGTAIRLEE